MDAQTNNHLSIAEYATRHGISATTVRRRIRAGVLAAEMRHGRYFITDNEPDNNAAEQETSQNEQVHNQADQSEIAYLREQLATKDKQIDQLSKLLAMTTQQNTAITKQLPPPRQTLIGTIKTLFRPQSVAQAVAKSRLLVPPTPASQRIWLSDEAHRPDAPQGRAH